MRLLHCFECGDIVAIRHERRTCTCGRSGAQTAADGITTSCEGPARVLELRDLDLLDSALDPPRGPYERAREYSWWEVVLP